MLLSDFWVILSLFATIGAVLALIYLLSSVLDHADYDRCQDCDQTNDKLSGDHD